MGLNGWTYIFGFLARFVRGQLTALPVPSADLAGRTVIVTGANVGIGKEAARHFARLGAARVIIACRDVSKGEAAKEDIEASLATSQTPKQGGAANDGASKKPKSVVEVWELDFSSFESVRAFGKRADSELDRLDILVENAGVLMLNFKEAEGWELTILVNVISTFLLAFLLLPAMRRTAQRYNVETHLSIVTSDVHWHAQFSERKLPEIFPSFKTAKNLHDRYGVSKLLDILLVKQLADAISPSSSSSSSPPPVIVNGPHPGFCRTELFRTIPVLGQVVLGFFLRLLGRSSEEGARTLVAAALAGPESHGRYMCDAKVGNEAPWVRSEEAEQVGRKAWAELLVILEGILPGVTANL